MVHSVGNRSSESARIRSIYESEYPVSASRAWSAAWSPRNPTAVYFRQSVELALVRALNEARLDLRDAEILDVGCGSAPHLRFFADLGANRERLHGVDLVPERIEVGRRNAPGVDLVVADATSLPFADNSFDVVSQFTALCNITDETHRRQAVNEMKRVLRPGGSVIWFDVVKAPIDAHYSGITPEHLRDLFSDFEVSAVQPMFHRWTEMLAARAPDLATALERLPLPKSNLLAVLRAPA